MKCFVALMLAALLTGFAGYAAAAQVQWSGRAYSFYFNGQPLQAVIAELAAREGIPVAVDPSLDTPVSARFDAMPAGKIFNKLATVYGLQWYYDGYTLHVGRVEDAESATIQLDSMPVALFKRQLQRLGVYDDRFHWSGTPGEGVVVVSGPKSYVERVKSLATLFASRNHGYDVAYKWVDAHGVTHYSANAATAPARAEVMRFARRPQNKLTDKIQVVSSDSKPAGGKEFDPTRLWQASQGK